MTTTQVSTDQNSTHCYTNTAILGIRRVEAPVVVTSSELDEQMSGVLERTGLRSGLLDGLVGIRERRRWDESKTFTAAAAEAGLAALAASGVETGSIGLLVNTSLSRDWLEPSTAVVIHDVIGLPPSCQNFDLTNACLGFVNGIDVGAAMIDAGMVEHVLVVDAEDSTPVREATMARLAGEGITADDVMSQFAALTLGSGAVAMVLGRADAHPEGHRLVASVTRAGSEHHRLCVGDNANMYTDLRGLLEAGLDLSEALWTEAAPRFGWDEGITRYVLHQVSQVHTDAMVERLGIDPERVPKTFPEHGNIGPASVPFTLAAHHDDLQPGDRVLLMGIGSGLNACVTEIAW